jgi:WhiB family transcriptional regulator, redox-sensing transcriptional regulator
LAQPCRARNARRDPDRTRQPEIGVFQHDGGRLAAELEEQALQRRRAFLHIRTNWVATAVGTFANHDFSRGKVQMKHPIHPAAEARITWVCKARCRSTDPDEMFVRGAKQTNAASICRHCPVIAECAADALDNHVEFGVWGGMTLRQRRVLLKQHPEVVS